MILTPQCRLDLHQDGHLDMVDHIFDFMVKLFNRENLSPF